MAPNSTLDSVVQPRRHPPTHHLSTCPFSSHQAAVRAGPALRCVLETAQKPGLRGAGRSSPSAGHLFCEIRNWRPFPGGP